MFYNACVFIFGVYVGQEYKNLPSVKAMVTSGLEYIRTKRIEEEDSVSNNRLKTLVSGWLFSSSVKKGNSDKED